MKAQRGNRGIVLYLYSFLNRDARWSVLLAPRFGRFTPGCNNSNIVFSELLAWQLRWRTFQVVFKKMNWQTVRITWGATRFVCIVQLSRSVGSLVNACSMDPIQGLSSRGYPLAVDNVENTNWRHSWRSQHPAWGKCICHPIDIQYDVQYVIVCITKLFVSLIV